MNLRKRGPAHWLAGAAAVGLTACPLPTLRAESSVVSIERQLALDEFSFHHDGILGTSMELLVQSPSAADARECHRRVLAEIERLRLILSTYDPQSEISRLTRGGAIESPELAEVLDAYAAWNHRTDNAINANMAAVIALWKSAAITGQLPCESALRDALAVPLSPNVDALGKGYVIDRAVAVARQFAAAGLLNIGGDLRAWGRSSFTVGVTDPANYADNAPPLATFDLRDAAVATSGSYARPVIIAGRRYSHLIDPRTLRPVDATISATVVAPDCLTANAMSTAACILGLNDGRALAARLATSHLITSSAERSDAGRLAAAAAAPAPWPKDFQVSLDLTLKVPRGGKAKRPYIAVWVEDAKGKIVRTVTVWGKQEKYLREMTAWWQVIGGDRKLVQSVTRATRDPGKYTIAWDGLDDAGSALPKGDYTIVVEINREHGRHVGEKTRISCGDKKSTATVKATAESDESPVTYGPKGN